MKVLFKGRMLPKQFDTSRDAGRMYLIILRIKSNQFGPESKIPDYWSQHVSIAATQSRPPILTSHCFDLYQVADHP